MDNTRYIYVTSLLESDEVSKPVSRCMIQAYKTPIQCTLLFYGITVDTRLESVQKCNASDANTDASVSISAKRQSSETYRTELLSRCGPG
jgi:hypothetical protein